MKVNPFYSPKQQVYHDCSNCTEGNNIEKENKKPGTGGRRHCSRCAELQRQGKC